MIRWVFKVIGFIIRLLLKMICLVLEYIFGFLFGWIGDLDDRMSGEQFEKYVQRILKRIGYNKVQLTKHSGDYGVDILAKYKGESYAIQCKLYSRPVGVAAVQQVYAGCVYYGCDKAVVVTNQTFTTQAQKLAASNQVILWDGEQLNRFKRKANARALFRRRKVEDDPVTHPYAMIITLLLEKGYASDSLLVDEFQFSEQKANYILDDLEFYDLVSQADEWGIRELYFDDFNEAMALLGG